MNNKDFESKEVAGTGRSNSRRSFLQKTAVGVVIASLPARSVWATGLSTSIVASGHGSDWAGGQQLALASPGYWKNHTSVWDTTITFSQVFGANPFNNRGNPRRRDKTFLQILNNPGQGRGKLGGLGNVNFHLVGMYLNAIVGSVSNSLGIYYPIIGPGRPFPSSDAFATYLYNAAAADCESVAAELDTIVQNNHV